MDSNPDETIEIDYKAIENYSKNCILKKLALNYISSITSDKHY